MVLRARGPGNPQVGRAVVPHVPSAPFPRAGGQPGGTWGEQPSGGRACFRRASVRRGPWTADRAAQDQAGDQRGERTSWVRREDASVPAETPAANRLASAPATGDPERDGAGALRAPRGPLRDPGDPGSSPESGSPHGACLSRRLWPCRSAFQEAGNKVFKEPVQLSPARYMVRYPHGGGGGGGNRESTPGPRQHSVLDVGLQFPFPRLSPRTLCWRHGAPRTSRPRESNGEEAWRRRSREKNLRPETVNSALFSAATNKQGPLPRGQGKN